jgi:hypothetical protein
MDVEYVRKIEKMTLEELWSLVQKELELEEWPASDWQAVEMILEKTTIRMDSTMSVTSWYSVVIMGIWTANGTGSGHDQSPIVAIFRAYLTFCYYGRSFTGR